MKVYNDAVAMTTELSQILAGYRENRDFNVTDWVKKKTHLINAYFSQSKLTGAVLGVSGGVDSAVALALVVEASNQPGSPIRKIVPLLLPAHDYVGATHQDVATEQAKQLCDHYGIEPVEFTQITAISRLITDELEKVLQLTSTPWAEGQLVAYSRTPVLYNTCSILTDNGFPSLVVGTTNLSEGGYLGYVGKASDGMVDLQIISDLYKSEVYQVAKLLRVPEVILNATPTGDMFDGREDEQVFGATYDFVELFHLWLQNGADPELKKNPVFSEGAGNLQKLHTYNQHKYLYKTPSVHLDILNARIPGGWDNPSWKEERNGN